MITNTLDQRVTTLPCDAYEIASVGDVMTPALAIYLDIVESNIERTVDLLGGDPERWRPHVKTAKLAAVMERLVAHGVGNFKCAATFELLTVCEAGARDVVVAYPCLGARARRVQQIASQFPDVRISNLVENEDDVELWRGTGIGVFIDVNPGMNRTGIEQHDLQQIIRVVRTVQQAAVSFRGIHYYDGNRREPVLAERTALAHSGYDQLLCVVESLKSRGWVVEEVITSGTPALPCSLSYAGFQSAGFIHRVSPGTLIYADLNSVAQLPPDWGYRPAAVVLSMIVSHPEEGLVICDAGHKTVSADAGFPNCAVLGHPELIPQRPSEEHLPIRVETGHQPPGRGEIIYLVPRHVCPTVNNFDHALIASKGHLAGVAPVSARGREAPLSAPHSFWRRS
jgi:D-serine deaminase-like pyridoxal phosphate-dependent protein